MWGAIAILMDEKTELTLYGLFCSRNYVNSVENLVRKQS